MMEVFSFRSSLCVSDVSGFVDPSLFREPSTYRIVNDSTQRDKVIIPSDLELGFAPFVNF